MCSNCTRAHVRSRLRSLMVSILVLIFFSIMITDLLSRCTQIEPTDTNVEALNPPELECNDPHGYYCDAPTEPVNL